MTNSIFANQAANPKRLNSFVIINGSFVLLSLAVCLTTWWPIYRTNWFFLSAISSVTLALLLAQVARERHWSGFKLFCGVSVIFVITVPWLAYPSLYQDFGQLAKYWLDAILNFVTGWKNLLSLSLPVGQFQAVLVPLFITLLYGTAFALHYAWKQNYSYFFAVIVLILVFSAGIAFGTSATEVYLLPFNQQLPAGREILLAFSMFVILIVWLSWRRYYFRQNQLLKIQTDIAISQLKIRQLTGRVPLAIAMVVLASLIGFIAAPVIAFGQARTVLRTAVQPELHTISKLSPLADYRNYFAGDFDTLLFSVQSTAKLPERLPLVTLEHYDGASFKLLAQGTASSAFSRLPYLSYQSGNHVTVQIYDWSQIWLPLSRDFNALTFTGAARSALTDSFYYSPQLATGIVLDATKLPGSSYNFIYNAPLSQAELVGQQPRSKASLNNPETVPSQLKDWFESQDLPHSGDGLLEAVSRLRSRGYLSHSLSESLGDSAETAQPWLAQLQNYSHIASLAGHSKDRIAELFQQLLDKADTTRSQENSALVAAVGDDEQFATAIALLARQIGFESRVVLGSYLIDDIAAGYRIPACEKGQCRGKNLAVWVEVRGQSDDWIALDSTPQYLIRPYEDTLALQDPQNPTEVTGKKTEFLAPESLTQNSLDQQMQPPDSRPESPNPFWTLLPTVLSASGLVVLILAPILLIILAKFSRSSRRAKSGSVQDRIANGWQEILDYAADNGHQISSKFTRTEQAKQLQKLGLIGEDLGLELVRIADQASFGNDQIENSTAANFWQRVKIFLKNSRRQLPIWQRFKACLSLRSFTQYLRPVELEVVRAHHQQVGAEFDVILAAKRQPARIQSARK